MAISVGFIIRRLDGISDKFVNSSGSDKRKSIVLSVFLYGTMLLILFFIRFWPPSNMSELADGGGGGGVTVNFGDSNVGMGNNFRSEEKVVTTQSKPIPVKEIQKEQNVISEENSKEDGIIIPKKINFKKVKEVVIKESKLVTVSKPIIFKPKVSINTNDALSSIIKGSKSGDGNTKTQGNQGSANGSLSNSGYGVGGSGGGTGGGNGNGTGLGSGGGNGSGSGKGSGAGYSLGNRKALSKLSPLYICDEVGKVVVQITVDKNGKTTNAVAGIKGSTNTAKCLLDQAKIAAMNTKWNADENAAEQQVGKIEYNFRLN